MSEFSRDNLLRSWKEIAAYLGCDVRTCHRWEGQRGMPVHRAGAETKSPVFAYRDELDRWFRETFTATNQRAAEAPRFHAWGRWAAVAGVLLAIAGGILFSLGKRVRRQPAGFAIDGSFLVVLDKQKRELWRRDTGLEDLRSGDFYRDNFQMTHRDQSPTFPSLVIKDVNGDGDAEVVFAPRRERDQTGEGWIYCYDRTGGKLWHFHGGEELRCGLTTYSPDYRIAGFVCHDLNSDGRLETVAVSYHAPDWPCQLAVIDATGNVTGQFWNAGYIIDLLFADINGDGREELVVCGVNNEYQGGFLSGFDTRKIGGGSPQSGDYACRGIGPGTELFYVTIPQTDISRARGEWISGFRHMAVTENGWIQATTSESLVYYFDFGLKCVQLTDGHGFKMLHQELAAAGKIKSVLGPAYLAQFRQGIRYWNGSAMVPEVSMNGR
ncbi:MAG TPA: VCBS repeat-containing protein [Candidatus Aminicenantes bacterium]|nr:VCBS repeat-containing protein [Candidatus Aminicenantes bacterium]HRY66118.1 VCBS repeat-containing protein [Candidatus Aminicenantes bacterium]HRZ73032.1 VCBS repeat-containing protein [Candidatus Aminicenantes bacterium]